MQILFFGTCSMTMQCFQKNQQEYLKIYDDSNIDFVDSILETVLKLNFCCIKRYFDVIFSILK